MLEWQVATLVYSSNCVSAVLSIFRKFALISLGFSLVELIIKLCTFLHVSRRDQCKVYTHKFTVY